MAEPEQTAPEPEAQPAPVRVFVPVRRRKRGWFLLGLGLLNALWSLVVLGAVLAVGAVYFFYDRPVVMPAWVETRIEQRLEQEFPALDIAFGELRLLMEEGWRPRVRLRDVVVRTAEGRELIRFSEARVRLSMEALRAGQLQPAQVALQGVFATLIREEDGSIAIQTGADAGLQSAQSTRITNPGAVIARIDEVLRQPGLAALDDAEMRGLTLQFIDRRAGRAFTLDGGRLIAQRKEGALVLSADLALLGDGAGVTTLAANFTSLIGQVEAEFGVRIDDVSAGDIATQSPAFAWLGALRAPISGAVRSGVRADGTLAPLNATLQIGAGVVQPNEGTRPIPFDAARSYFSYDAASGVLVFDEVSVASKWVTARANGTATLTGLRTGRLEDLVGQFSVSQLRADPANFYATPVELDGAEIDFRLQPAPFKLEIGRLDVFDGGETRHATGVLLAEPEGWRLALDAQTATVSPARIMALWPEPVATRTRDWLVENLTTAELSNADFALRIAPDRAPRTALSFDFREAELRFLPDLPPLTRGRGHASLDAGRFVVTLDEGEMQAGAGGTVQVTQSAFILPDLGVKDGMPAVVRLNASAAITAALWTLDQPPMQIMSRAGLPVDLAAGQVTASGTLAFPLKRGGGGSAVVFDVAGDLRNVASDSLIKGRSLSAQHMALVASNTEVTLSGQGALDGVPFDARWKQSLGTAGAGSALRATAQLNTAALEAFGVALPSGMLEGTATAQVDVTLAQGAPPQLALRSDLRGLGMRIPELGWRKARTAAGELAVQIRLGAQPQVTRLDLDAEGLSARGAVSLDPRGGLDVMELTRLRVGDWLDVRAALEGRGAGRAPQVVVRAGKLDMRSAQLGGDAQTAGAATPRRADAPPAAPMRVVLDRLQITDTIWLQGFAGTFNTTGGLEGPFEARINGGTGVSGRIVPQRGRMAVRVTSADAGGVLRSAGVLQQAVGGTVELSLLPVGSGGAFDGQLRIAGVSIKQAPAMAALVNSISVVGLVNEMNGAGIYFDEVEAEFRLTPGRMTLSRGSAVGASLGLSMDGVFATDTGQIAMQGVITPVYLLNGIGSLLTRKGEGLLGFNYTLGGAASAPKVAINPLSVLAPGGLRDILRPPKTQIPQVAGETPPVAAGAEKTPVEPAYEGR